MSKWANTWTSVNGTPYLISEIIDYNPTGYFVEGVFISCPNECVQGWYYIKDSNLFTAPPVGDPDLIYTSWNYSTNEWETNEIEKYNYLVDQVKLSYAAIFADLKDSYTSAMMRDDFASITSLKADFVSELASYESEIAAIPVP